MKARRITVQRVFLVFCVVALLGAYLHFGILPGNLKAYVIRQAAGLAGHQVSFDKTIYLPFRGLTFYNLSVRSKAGVPLFSAKSLTLDAKLVPFLTEKKIVVTKLVLESPVIDWVPGEKKAPEAAAPPLPPPMTRISGQIEVPVVPQTQKLTLAALQQGPDALVPENVYLEEVEIRDGVIRILPARGREPLEELRSVEVRLAFRRPPILTLDGTFKIGRVPYAFVGMKGRWDLERGVFGFDLRTKTEGVPQWFDSYQTKNFVRFEGGSVGASLKIGSDDERRIRFRADADLRDAKLGAKGATYVGRMTLAADGVFDIEERRFLSYAGDLDFLDVTVENLSTEVPLLKNVSGRVKLEPETLRLPGMHGEFGNIPFDASGELGLKGELPLQMEIRASAPAKDLLAAIPSTQPNLLAGLDIDGPCYARTTLSGNLKAGKPAARHSVEMRGLSVKDPKRSLSATDIRGRLKIFPGAYELEGVKLSWSGRPCSIDARLPKRAGETGNALISFPEGALDAKFAAAGEDVAVSDGSLRWNGLSAHFSGTAHGFKETRLDLKGTATADLALMLPALAKSSPAVKDLNLAGKLSGKFTLRGPMNSPVDWDLKSDASARWLRVKNLRLDEAEIQIRLKNRALNIPYFHVKPYGGSGGLRAYIGLDGDAKSFQARIYANNVDLARAMRDFKPESELAGTATFEADLKGLLGREETFTGQGSVDIRNGHIWKTDLFKKMGELPFVRVEGLAEVVFTEARSIFSIRDKRFWTENLQLASETVDLSFRGSVGFDQTLDLVMSIQYSKGILAGAFDTGGIVPFVIEKASGMISEYKVTGTLSKPKNEKILLPSARSAVKTVTGGLI